jgi:hypothetical protein
VCLPGYGDTLWSEFTPLIRGVCRDGLPAVERAWTSHLAEDKEAQMIGHYIKCENDDPAHALLCAWNRGKHKAGLLAFSRR